MGLIDTFTAGFRIVRRRIWLAFLPVLLDTWLWLGPQLSIEPFLNQILAFWSPTTLPAELAGTAELYQQLLVEAGERFNLLWLLGSRLMWLDQLVPALPEPNGPGPWPVPFDIPPLALLAWVPLLACAGLGLGSLFLTTLVSQLQPTNGTAGFWVRRGLRTWAMAVAYGLLLLALGFVAILLMSAVLTAVLLFLPGLGSGLSTLGMLLAGWAAVWAYLFLYFVMAAVAWDGIGLAQAMWRSFNVVARNFWGTVGLALLTNVILAGFGFIWQRLASGSPWGIAAGIAGNAFLLAGLAAARLLFYQNRYTRWQEMLLAQRTETVS